MNAPTDPALHSFFSNEKGELPPFIHGIDDFVHVKIVYLRGSLDGSASKQMEFFFRKAEKNPGLLDKNVLLDFRKVEQIDSASIAQLVKALGLLKKKNYKLGMVNVSDRMRSTLEILKLDAVFRVFDSKTEALEEIMRWSENW